MDFVEIKSADVSHVTVGSRLRIRKASRYPLLYPHPLHVPVYRMTVYGFVVQYSLGPCMVIKHLLLQLP